MHVGFAGTGNGSMLPDDSMTSSVKLPAITNAKSCVCVSHGTSDPITITRYGPVSPPSGTVTCSTLLAASATPCPWKSLPRSCVPSGLTTTRSRLLTKLRSEDG
eukprot:3565854-Rhodomonas_salina.2